MASSQLPGQVSTQTLSIGNTGGVDLDWEIAEAPLSVSLGLSLDSGSGSSNVSPSGTASAYSMILDGGEADTSIGVGGIQFIWFNRFTPASYNFPITLDSIEVMFGSNVGAGGISVGQLVDIYLYEDADGNPVNGATHVATLNDQAIQAVNGSDWSTFPLPSPVTFNGPGDILIAVVNRTAGVAPNTFPASVDRLTTNQQRSWIGWDTGAAPGNPPDLTAFPTLDLIGNLSAALGGNWLIRGFGTGIQPCENPANVPWLELSSAQGTTAPGSVSEVVVTMDSSSLSLGVHEAVLCIESNDPDRPTEEVLIMLTVVEDELFADRFEE
jgi:hypothetical protein